MYIVRLCFVNDKERILVDVTQEELDDLLCWASDVRIKTGENSGLIVNMRNVIHWDYQLQREELDE